MKNQLVGWGLLGTSGVAVLSWSWTTGNYFTAWLVLLGGIFALAIGNRGWLPILAGYLGLFALLSNFSIPTRMMLTALSLALTMVLVYRKSLDGPDDKVWLLTLIVLSLPIATFSGPAGGAGGWSEWLVQILGLEGSTAEMVVWWVRKTLHFTVYGTLALAAFKSSTAASSSVQTASTLAVIWSLSHAGFDELKQLSIPGRTGSPMDLIIDLVGALTAVGIASWHAASRRP